MKTQKSLRVCEYGHRYLKSGDCLTCSTCAKDNKPDRGFLARMSSPARNALIHEGVDTVQKLSRHSEKEILEIHGIGPASLPNLESCFSRSGSLIQRLAV